MEEYTDEWLPQPTDLTDNLDDSDEGVKRERVTVGAAIVRKDFWNALFRRYSTWNRLRRVVAWLIRAL